MSGPLLQFQFSSDLLNRPYSEYSTAQLTSVIFSDPKLSSSLIKTGSSVAQAVLDKIGLDQAPAWARFTSDLVITLAGSYLTHEAGHIHHLFGPRNSDSSSLSNFKDHVSGLNTTFSSTHQMAFEPYEPLRDLEEVVQSLDLGFYLTVQEPFIREFIDSTGGDTAEYFKYRDKKGNAPTLERLAAGALAVWQVADLWPNLKRLGQYYLDGKVPNAPHADGSWDIKTSGTLSSRGPLFFGQFINYLENNSTPFPQAIHAGAWINPLRNPDHPPDFGIEAGVSRLPLVNTRFGTLAASALVGLGYNGTGDETSQAFHGHISGGLHLLGDDYEVGFSAGYTDPKYLWQESASKGFQASVAAALKL